MFLILYNFPPVPICTCWYKPILHLETNLIKLNLFPEETEATKRTVSSWVSSFMHTHYIFVLNYYTCQPEGQLDSQSTKKQWNKPLIISVRRLIFSPMLLFLLLILDELVITVGTSVQWTPCFQCTEEYSQLHLLVFHFKTLAQGKTYTNNYISYCTACVQKCFIASLLYWRQHLPFWFKLNFNWVDMHSKVMEKQILLQHLIA